MNEQIGPKAVIDDLREALPLLRDTLRELPAILRHVATLLAEPGKRE